jgi:hypothetical protein
LCPVVGEQRRIPKVPHRTFGADGVQGQRRKRPL